MTPFHKLLSFVFVVFLLLLSACVRPRFTTFRGETLDVDRTTLSQGTKLAEKYCSSCHLTPHTESMSQDNATYMLAYMGLFHGIDASQQLDPIEKEAFHSRYEFLKKTGNIPLTPQISRDDWKILRAYYLGYARYPFVSTEKATVLAEHEIPFKDKGVTLLKKLSDDKIAVGGGTTGMLSVMTPDYRTEFSVALDTPPVHIEETTNGFYALTLGSLLGALNDTNHAALYFIDKRTHRVQKIIDGIGRATHFLVADTNGDGKDDFIVATFGTITGGGVLLYESGAKTYAKRSLSSLGSIVRLALLKKEKAHVEFLALAGGAKEALAKITFTNGVAQEKILVEYPPHLGSVWLELYDIDGDGKNEALVLSGDNADAGPYNETKNDQGLRVYAFVGETLKQRKFLSAPGALSMTLDKNRLYLARFYTAPATKQDLTVFTFDKKFNFSHRHFTLSSRPTVMAVTEQGLIVGSGNFPMLAKNGNEPVRRFFSGPALFRVRDKSDGSNNLF